MFCSVFCLSSGKFVYSYKSETIWRCVCRLNEVLNADSKAWCSDLEFSLFLLGDFSMHVIMTWDCVLMPSEPC